MIHKDRVHGQYVPRVSGLTGGIQVCVAYGAFCWLILVLS